MRTALWISLIVTLAAVPAFSQNQLINPGFDTDLEGWRFPGFPESSATWSSLDANTSPTSGSAAIQAFISGRGILQDVRVVAGESYDFGAQLRVPTSPGGQAWVEAEWVAGTLTGGLCVGASLGSVATPMTASHDVWEAVTLNAVAPAGALCARIRVAVSSGGAGFPHTANADNVEFRRTGTTGSFHTITPCRLVDTRTAPGPFGGPALTSPGTRDFAIAGNCGIAADATAVAANFTVIGPTGGGHLKAYPTGEPAPETSAINFNPGVTRSNIAILTLGVGGMETISCDIPGGGSTDLVLDVAGYFR